MKLRARHRVVVEDDEATTVVLRQCDVHEKNGDTSPYMCSICRVNLVVRKGQAHWVVCPQCNNVHHQACIDQCTRHNDEDIVKCPMCKYQTSAEEVDAWDASDLIAKVLGDDTFDDGDIVVEPSDRVLRSAKRSKVNVSA